MSRTSFLTRSSGWTRRIRLRTDAAVGDRRRTGVVSAKFVADRRYGVVLHESRRLFVLAQADETPCGIRAIEAQSRRLRWAGRIPFSSASRFNPATSSGATFPLLYLTENAVAALYEVEALYGSPSAGLFVPNPQAAWLVINVRVTLQRVADLTDVAEQAKLGTTAQELTGDWQGHLRRNALPPSGNRPAPPQRRISARRSIRSPASEGFRTVPRNFQPP